MILSSRWWKILLSAWDLEKPLPVETGTELDQGPPTIASVSTMTLTFASPGIHEVFQKVGGDIARQDLLLAAFIWMEVALAAATGRSVEFP